MTGADEAYAPFVATHEARLVRSLVAEGGLSPAAATAVAADVLPVAFQRSFSCDGAAYGWLRVAARHRAAGSTTWADAADTALGQAGLAAAALAGLSAGDRELLRLRYVEGLLPDAVAERLGTTVADVLARLERARGATTRSLTKPRTLAVPLPRAAAAMAAAAAAVLLSMGGGTSPAAPPAVAAPRPAPAVEGTLPVPVATVTDDEPATANGRVVAAPRTVVVRVRPAVPVTRRPAGRVVRPETPCQTGCHPPRTLTDELHVNLPSELAPVVGDEELVVKQDVAQEVVSVCEATAAVPAGVARCVPAEH